MTGEETTGAILIGVCRGRLSEGLDFKDRKARCVIVVGIPFPQLGDPKVIFKQYYLDQKRNTMGREQLTEDGKVIHNIAGMYWYNQQAFRAVN